jgi:hypothetical protein
MGFDLKSKKWQALDVDCCREPKYHTGAIENLVLANDKQELIKALVHKYTSSKRAGKTPSPTKVKVRSSSFTDLPVLEKPTPQNASPNSPPVPSYPSPAATSEPTSSTSRNLSANGSSSQRFGVPSC